MIKAIIIFLFLSTSACTSFNFFYTDDSFQTVHTDIESVHQTRAEYYEKLGQAYSYDEQTDRAIENYKLSILHNSKRASTHLFLSFEYQKSHQNHLAMIELEKALELEPQNSTIQKAAAEFYYKNKLFSKSQKVFNKLSASQKDKLNEHWVAFYYYKARNDNESALTKLNQLKIKFSKDFRVYYELAMLHKELDNQSLYFLNVKKAYDLAKTNVTVVQEYVDLLINQQNYSLAYQVAIDYSTQNTFDLDLSKRLAFLAIQNKKYNVALGEFQKQKSATDNFSEAQIKIGHVYYMIGDLKNAEKNYALVIDKNYRSEALYYLSQIYFTQDRYQDALKALDAVHVRSDYYPKAQVSRANYLNIAEKKEQAMLVMHKAYRVRSDSLLVTKIYADMLIANGRHTDAQKVLDIAVEKFPTDADLKLKLAYIHYYFRNEVEFKKQIESALELNPDSADSYAMLAEVLYLKDNKPEQILYFSKKALELKSRNPNVKPLLTWALMQKDSSSEAIDIFEKFYEENPQELFFARSLAKIYEKAYLKGKFDLLSKEIMKIESDEQISSRLMFREDPGTEQIVDFEPQKNRMPAETKQQ